MERWVWEDSLVERLLCQDNPLQVTHDISTPRDDNLKRYERPYSQQKELPKPAQFAEVPDIHVFSDDEPIRASHQREYTENQKESCKMIFELDYCPTSPEQLAASVKSIYAGLTKTETKCIHTAQTPPPSGSFDTWKAIIDLHVELLNEFHDFFFETQHPSASPALRQLPGKYSMIGRMWKHGIHNCLELLRRNPPDTVDFTVRLIYQAYATISVLLECVPAFEDAWLEMLGDLSRYRMCIGLGTDCYDFGDRIIWSDTARVWYNRAANKAPDVGRLYHHLGMLSTDPLERFYSYSRSLTSVQRFLDAREKLIDLSEDPFEEEDFYFGVFRVVHRNLFKENSSDENERNQAVDAFDSVLTNYLSHDVDSYINRSSWKTRGVYLAVANVAAMFQYGSDTSTLLSAEFSQTTNLTSFRNASRLVFSTMKIALQRSKDAGVYEHVHIMLIFLVWLAPLPQFSYISDYVPWNELVTFCNSLVGIFFGDCLSTERSFPDAHYRSPLHCSNIKRPSLPEERQIRGQIWCQKFFPSGWFHELDMGELEIDNEIPFGKSTFMRMGRILGLCADLASSTPWIQFDKGSFQFSISPLASPDLPLPPALPRALPPNFYKAAPPSPPHPPTSPPPSISSLLSLDSSQPAAQNSKPSPRSRKSGFIGLPIVVETIHGPATIMACPDSGSDENIVSFHLIQLLKLPIEDVKENKQFVLANGRIITALGTVVIKHGFSTEYPTRMPASLSQFHVFPAAATSMIIGRPFLEESKTMTHFRSRLARSYCRPRRSFFVQAIGKQRKRLFCVLENQRVLAFADSGAELNLMSLSYLRRRGFNLEPETLNIAFADNSEGQTLGTVGVSLSFQKAEEFMSHDVEARERLVQLRMSDERWTEFHVLESLVADIVLGADFLESHRVFEESQDAFVELPDEPKLLPNVHGVMHLNDKEQIVARAFSHVKSLFKGRARGKATGSKMDLEAEIEEDDQRENARREKEDLRIAGISGDDDIRKAREEEDRMRRKYDERRRVKLAGRP